MVRNFFFPLAFLCAAVAGSLSPLRAAQVSSSPRVTQFAAVTRQAPAPAESEQPPPNPNLAPGSSSPNAALPVIVLDPAHGGTDTGARGENGLAEKDLTLQIARTLQAQLLNRGFRVVMTRTDDSNPSYDDRAAVANAYRDAVFITIHVGSTGKMGTVRTYYDQFWTSAPAVPSSSKAPAPSVTPGPAVAGLPANTLISWQHAQRPYVNDSHRLADILQLQFAQMFPGSPPASTAFALRDLRSVANPAVAIEIANVSAPSADALLALSGPLSVAIERAVRTFRQSAVSETP
jgi:N-acetylmuramoyl-L-alanine amidase